MTKTEKMLRELIALPSVNPAFAPPGSPYTGEENIARYLAEVARRGGLETELLPVLPGRPNLWVRLAGRNRKCRHRIVLAPHLDTVGGETLPGTLFTPRAKKGRLYGRGSCDTKGSVAAMVCALLELTQGQRRPEQTEILLVGLADEENTQTGSRCVAKNRLRADLAIVGEPTSLQVVTAHKGDLWLQLETCGKAAHGARPELGRNAVHEMARIVHALETDYARSLAQHLHPLLGRATVNVGAIAGGCQPNIVPDCCWIKVDRRTLPGEEDAEVKRELLRFLRRRGFRPHLTDTKGVPSRPLETRPNLPMVQRLAKLIGQTRPVGVDYFSDGGVLAAAGIPSVLFGPGNIAQAHTAEEWISLRQLEQAKHILRAFLEQLP
jgi:succinyl-diaminopimelate desuccinylase